MADNDSDRSSVTSASSASRSRTLIANLRGSRRYSKTGEEINKATIYKLSTKDVDSVESKPIEKAKARRARRTKRTKRIR